jgi:hypothetical protein
MKHKLHLLIILMILIPAVLLPGSKAQAATYTVTNPDDDEHVMLFGSLHWAITQANANPGADTIEFNIPAHLCDPITKVCTITLERALPALTDDSTTINGYSQSGAAQATNDSPAVIVIEIDGSSTAYSTGLIINSAGNTIQGLAIFNFRYDGIVVFTPAANNNHIEGNFLGLDASGATAGNGYAGVYIHDGAYENTIGGDLVSQRNIISGNGKTGIEISDDETDDNIINGNYIGTTPDGMSARGNVQHGILIKHLASSNDVINNLISANQYGVYIQSNLDDLDSTSDNVIENNGIGIAEDLSPLGNTYDGVFISFLGQSNDIIANYIAYNGDAGVQVDTPTAYDNNIVYNIIKDNQDKGIKLTNGANHEIEPPEIHQFHLDTFSVSGAACPNCYIQVFASTSNHGQGEKIIGEGIAGAAGDFAIQVNELPGAYLTATATNVADLEGTSEFSEVYIYSLNYLPLIISGE